MFILLCSWLFLCHSNDYCSCKYSAPCSELSTVCSLLNGVAAHKGNINSLSYMATSRESPLGMHVVCNWKHELRESLRYHIAGKFRVARAFTFLKAEQSTRKLGETPTHRYFTCKTCGGCGFLAMKRKYYIQPRKKFEGLSSHIPWKFLHPRKFPAFWLPKAIIIQKRLI